MTKNRKLFDDFITIQYSTTAQVTPRTIVVAEAFGLGIDEEKTFTVFDKQPITVYQGDVVYITGDSGGGKSSLLKALSDKIKNVIQLNDIKVKDDEVLIEGVGDSVEDALRILTRSGLGDAFLMLRKYKELSDGQKYRYLIAKMISSKKDVWLIDEFCATLDRPLALVIAFSIQKIARSLGKTLLVATTHHDMLRDLQANLVISKNFGGRVQVDRPEYKEHEFSLFNKISYRLGTYQDYQQSGLSSFHYKNDKRPAGLINTYLAEYDGQIIGALLTRYPALEIRERNVVTNKKYVKNYKQLNAEVEMISRVVVHSKFRGVGLGTKLVKAYLDSQYAKLIVESMSVMSQHNPFFERAGMERIILKQEDKKVLPSYNKMIAALTDLKFDVNLTASTTYNLDRVKLLKKAELDILVPLVMKEFWRVNHLYDVDNKERLDKVKEVVDKTNAGQYTLEFLAEAIKKTRKPVLSYVIWSKDKTIMQEIKSKNG